jgi:hypothetical protein
MNYSTLAARLFQLEEWQVVVLLLEDMELEAISMVRAGDVNDGAATIQVVDRLRSKFSEIAADKGLENPFARRN